MYKNYKVIKYIKKYTLQMLRYQNLWNLNYDCKK